MADYNKLKRLDMALAKSMLKKRNLSQEEKEYWEKLAEQKQKYNKWTEFSKAFDLINHTLLIDKMIDMGVMFFCTMDLWFCTQPPTMCSF